MLSIIKRMMSIKRDGSAYDQLPAGDLPVSFSFCGVHPQLGVAGDFFLQQMGPGDDWAVIFAAHDAPIRWVMRRGDFCTAATYFAKVLAVVRGSGLHTVR